MRLRILFSKWHVYVLHMDEITQLWVGSPYLGGIPGSKHCLCQSDFPLGMHIIRVTFFKAPETLSLNITMWLRWNLDSLIHSIFIKNTSPKDEKAIQVPEKRLLSGSMVGIIFYPVLNTTLWDIIIPILQMKKMWDEITCLKSQAVNLFSFMSLCIDCCFDTDVAKRKALFVLTFY